MSRNPNSFHVTKWGYVILAGGLLVGFLCEGLTFIRANSQTFDEAVHLTAGYSYWATDSFRLNREHPPLTKELAALPVYLWYECPIDPDRWQEAGLHTLAQEFLYGPSSAASHSREILNVARLPNLLLGTALVGLVGWWSYRLWGRGGALLGMALAAFDPNLIAHSSLVTTDLGISFFIFLTFYLLWEYDRSHRLSLLLGIGIAVGLALASKFSAIMLLGLVPMAMGCRILAGSDYSLLNTQDRAGKNPTLLARGLGAVLPLLLVAWVAALILWGTYFFGDLTTWWNGLRWQLGHQDGGHPAFLLGEYSRTGWPHYFFVAFFVKTPLGTLILIGVSLLLFRRGKPLTTAETAFILLPLGMFVASSVVLQINIGIRHFLHVYPFLFVVAARLATVRIGRKWVMPSLISACATMTIASSLCICPHYLAYFNEAIGGPSQGWRILSDSNIDWGQDLEGVKAYMEDQDLPMIYLSYFGSAPPEHFGIRYQYVPAFGHPGSPPSDTLPAASRREVLAISVFSLHGVFFRDKSLYAWLWPREPIATIGHSIRVYDLTGDAEAHLALAKVYLATGSESLAQHELHRVLDLAPRNVEAKELLRERFGVSDDVSTKEHD